MTLNLIRPMRKPSAISGITSAPCRKGIIRPIEAPSFPTILARRAGNDLSDTKPAPKHSAHRPWGQYWMHGCDATLCPKPGQTAPRSAVSPASNVMVDGCGLTSSTGNPQPPPARSTHNKRGAHRDTALPLRSVPSAQVVTSRVLSQITHCVIDADPAKMLGQSPAPRATPPHLDGGPPRLEQPRQALAGQRGGDDRAPERRHLLAPVARLNVLQAVLLCGRGPIGCGLGASCMHGPCVG